MRGRIVAGVAILAALIVVVGGILWWSRGSSGTAFAQAFGVVPANSKRISFTDWAQVRRQLGVRGIDSTPSQTNRWMQRAYNRDYSPASSLSDQAAAVQRAFGFSPANAAWEAYAQSSRGAVDVLKMAGGVDFTRLADTLHGLGYRRPATADGVWLGGPDLLAAIDPEITPELQYVVLLRDQGIVLTSDTAAYAASSAKVVEGDAASVADRVGTVTDMAAKVGNPIAAVTWANDFACADLAMAKASTGEQQEAATLIARAGPVSALSGLTMAMSAGRTLTVAEEFDSGQQANQNLRPRARLAVGPAVGRGDGTFADDFRLRSARTDGSTVLLTLQPRTSGQFVLSALYDGPVIFATC